MQDEQTCVKQLKQRFSNNHKMRTNESLKWFVKLNFIQILIVYLFV